MLAVIIPTINEKKNLETLLPHLSRYADEIVVVDDGSTDGTTELAKKQGCIVVERKKRLGVGKAVYDGVEASSKNIVAVMDADHSHPLEALKSAVLIEIDAVDIIKFSRFIAGGSMEDKRRHFLMRYFNRLLAGLAKVHTQDFTGGFLIAKKETFDYKKTASGGEWNLEYMIHNRKKRIAEIPYHYRRRVRGRSNWNQWQDIGRALQYLRYLFAYLWQGR